MRRVVGQESIQPTGTFKLSQLASFNCSLIVDYGVNTRTSADPSGTPLFARHINLKVPQTISHDSDSTFRGYKYLGRCAPGFDVPLNAKDVRGGQYEDADEAEWKSGAL